MIDQPRTLDGARTLVMGASSGIGGAVARAAAGRVAASIVTLILGARETDSLVTESVQFRPRLNSRVVASSSAEAGS